MKHLLLTCLIISYCFLSFGQTEAEKFGNKLLSNKNLSETELKAQLIKYDYSTLFTHTDNSAVYGFIGETYQRIRIKFISINKNPSSPDTYTIYGKSMVRNDICEFRGNITISNIRRYKSTVYGVDNEYKNKGIKAQFVILGVYSLSENQNKNNSGIFKGMFETDFYIDKKNKVHYDDIELQADGFTNNQFVGQWSSHISNLVKRCNWGDFRIPNSHDLDIGAGEFSPGDKYLRFGWQTVRDLYGSPLKRQKAKQTAEAKWWE